MNIVEAVEKANAEAVRLLQQLVNLDSATTNTKGVDAVGAVLAKRLQVLGFEVERIPAPPPYGHQIVGRLGPGPYEELLVGIRIPHFPKALRSPAPSPRRMVSYAALALPT